MARSSGEEIITHYLSLISLHTPPLPKYREEVDNTKAVQWRATRLVRAIRQWISLPRKFVQCWIFEILKTWLDKTHSNLGWVHSWGCCGQEVGLSLPELRASLGWCYGLKWRRWEFLETWSWMKLTLAVAGLVAWGERDKERYSWLHCGT